MVSKTSKILLTTMNKMKNFQNLFIIMNDFMPPRFNNLSTNHLSRTSQGSRKRKNRSYLRFHDVLIALFIGLNHAERNARKFSQFFLGEMGLFPNGFQHVFARV